MGTSFQNFAAPLNASSSGAGTGSPCGSDGDAVGGDDDECFSIELDLEPPEHLSKSTAAQSLNEALNLINSGTPDAVIEGLQLVLDHVSADASWRDRFLALDGASLCVELMGCFSAADVQCAAAQVCVALAKTGQDACTALLDADVGSMLQMHIKQTETSLTIFEHAAQIVSALASSAGQAGHALTQLGLMAHLTGILAKDSHSSTPARTAALAAITSLCYHQGQARLNFFQYGGVSSLLQSMLRDDRSADDETLAALTLFEGVLARMPECRDIMVHVRGMEVLAQVHRDAEASEQTALRALTVTVLAQLTYRHPKNLAQLHSDTQLLGDPMLYHEVVATHESSETSPRQQNAFPLMASSLPQLLHGSTHDSDPDSSPPTSARVSGVTIPGRKSSSDNSSRALRRMSTSVRGMFGSMRKYLRNQNGEEEPASGAAGSAVHSRTFSSNSGGVLVA